MFYMPATARTFLFEQHLEDDQDQSTDAYARYIILQNLSFANGTLTNLGRFWAPTASESFTPP